MKNQIKTVKSVVNYIRWKSRTGYDIWDLFAKSKAVIESCESQEQLTVAIRHADSTIKLLDERDSYYSGVLSKALNLLIESKHLEIVERDKNIERLLNVLR